MSRSAICNYENGKREKPQIPVVQAIAKVLDVKWYELMGWEDLGGGLYGKQADPETYKRISDSNERYQRTSTIERKRLLDLYDSMNEDGKNKAVSFIAYLADQQENLLNKKTNKNQL